ncbi:protein MEI2-like 4 isoform X1 [Zingiber officinale]|uniref:protein MEI2-like 4 isoform X1 n=1 Tax=Zingiber officinale TaxID=94328 RepID=UPI001C4D683A|nr:protein MEI2-like 4 isoform X1 [Zingiber officinale]
MSGSKSVSSSLDALYNTPSSPPELSELSKSWIPNDLKTKLNIGYGLMEPQKFTSISTTPRVTSHAAVPQADLLSLPSSICCEGNTRDISGSHYENGLFSCSFSKIFDKKARLSSNISSLVQSIDSINLNYGEDEPFESMKEIEAQTIGNLLPDDDDLLSGVIDDVGNSELNGRNDIDDDIFYCGGGMELENDDNLNVNKPSDFAGRRASNGQQGGLVGPFSGKHPFGEHPSRTLFVRNINSNAEDSELRTLFEQYGDIRTLYTTCKHRGFVMISYYDLRAAQNAMQELQNKPLRGRKLDIHFSIPKDNPSEQDINQGTLIVSNLDSSVINDELHQIFGVYGEIKEILDTPYQHNHKFIEFYDIRAAEAALHALNWSDIGGQKIKFGLSCTGDGRQCLMNKIPQEMGQKELNGFCFGSPNESLSGCPGCFGSSLFGSSFENGTIQDFKSAQAPSISIVEAKFNGSLPSIPPNLPSPKSIASNCNRTNQPVQGDMNLSLGQMSFGFQDMPALHPHSLPNYDNGMKNGNPYSPSTRAMGVGVISRPAEGINKRNIQTICSGSLAGDCFDTNQAFGLPTNGSCSLSRNQHVWSNENAHQDKSPNPVFWKNSLSLVNSIPTHHQSQIYGSPSGQSHMFNTVLPTHHHVGSAPALNPSLWDRRYAYSGDSMEPHAFHPGSLGSMGLSAISQLHWLELASHNIFSHAAGNCIEPSISAAHIGIPSSQNRGQFYHGRNHIFPMPNSFDVPAERIRNRRNDANSNQSDSKKQFELDIERIIRGEDSRTTLMIKNIPNKYTSKMLLAAIDENHHGTYDFIYLPIDFKNKCNVGYAFINMTNPQHIIVFYQSFNGKKWEKFNSEKVASLAYARIQGKAALIAHFQNSSLMNEDKRCRPILFHTDGPNAGDQEPFPVGNNIKSRSGRSRTACIEDNHLKESSSLASGEDSCDAMAFLPGS